MPNTKFQPCRRFEENDLVERKTKNFFKVQRKVRIRRFQNYL